MTAVCVIFHSKTITATTPTFWLVHCGRGQHPSSLSSSTPSLWLCRCRNNMSACWGEWPGSVRRGRRGRRDKDEEEETEGGMKLQCEKQFMAGDLEIPAGSLYIIPAGRGVCLCTVWLYVCVCACAPCLPLHVCFSSSVKTQKCETFQGSPEYLGKSKTA